MDDLINEVLEMMKPNEIVVREKIAKDIFADLSFKEMQELIEHSLVFQITAKLKFKGKLTVITESHMNDDYYKISGYWMNTDALINLIKIIHDKIKQ